MPQNYDGGAAVVGWLKEVGVGHVFSVSGGPINPVYRACAEFGLSLVHVRHEAAACFMAEAASRVTGKPGVAVVTLGPGATNTLTPALVATLAGTPMIIIAAQAATRSFERGAGMAHDVLPMVANVTKWSARVLDVNRIPEYLDIAWRKMWAGRPGPVFLEIPSDIMAATMTGVAKRLGAPASVARPGPRPADIASLAGEIAAAPASIAPHFLSADAGAVDRAWVDGMAAAWNAERAGQLAESGGGGVLHPVAAVDAVVAAAPEDTIFVTSHGNVDFWADARLRIRAPGCYLRAGQSGALGAEMPYGAGAAFARPGAPVIVFVGDGGVGFHVTELDTAERHGRPFVIVVLDDELWGAIALPQEMRYGTTYEMGLTRRDWAKVAEGLGCKGYVCSSAGEIAAAIGDALASGKPALVQVAVRSVISPYMKFIS